MTTNVSYPVLRVADVDKAADFYLEIFNWGWETSNSRFSLMTSDVAIHRVRSHGGTADEPEGASSEHERWVECMDDQGTRFELYAPAV